MSLLAELEVRPGSTHKRKRIGRGIGSGTGKTAGKGHKGQKARKGTRIKPGFEGGQTILARRLPKFGFSSRNRVKYSIINLDQLANFEGDVTPETLLSAGLVRKNYKVKILAKGELKKALNIKAHKFSATAKAAIEKAGGKAETL